MISRDFTIVEKAKGGKVRRTVCEVGESVYEFSDICGEDVILISSISKVSVPVFFGGFRLPGKKRPFLPGHPMTPLRREGGRGSGKEKSDEPLRKNYIFLTD